MLHDVSWLYAFKMQMGEKEKRKEKSEKEEEWMIDYEHKSEKSDGKGTTICYKLIPQIAIQEP